MIDVKDVARTAHVKRWQIVRVAREQTLAEHSYLVAMYTKAICTELDINLAYGVQAMEWALIHDLPEVVTGDLATPAKQRMNFDDSGVFDDYDALKKAAAGLVCRIVKIADLLEACAFLNIEGMGVHSAQVMGEIEDKLDRLVDECKGLHPEYDWQKVMSIKWRLYNV